MSNALTKSNEGFRPKAKTGRMHQITVNMWLPGNPGEIAILREATHALSTLAVHGTMPTNTESVTREVLDTDEVGVVE
jgi:hypothetical protein